jgi:hypothetical protein
MAGRFWKPYIGQAVGVEWDMADLIGGAGERAAVQFATICRKEVMAMFFSFSPGPRGWEKSKFNSNYDAQITLCILYPTPS